MQHKYDELLHKGKFMHLYGRHYATDTGLTKVYEMISRNPKLEKNIPKVITEPQAICMAIHNPDRDKILLLSEFRMSVNQWVINFPCGLIDENESASDAGTRELNEETGLNLLTIDTILPPHYTAVGFSDETVTMIIGTANGSFKPSTSIMEEIEPGWYTKEQVRNMLQTELFAGRTQIYCHLWANT